MREKHAFIETLKTLNLTKNRDKYCTVGRSLYDVNLDIIPKMYWGVQTEMTEYELHLQKHRTIPRLSGD